MFEQWHRRRFLTENVGRGCQFLGNVLRTIGIHHATRNNTTTHDNQEEDTAPQSKTRQDKTRHDKTQHPAPDTNYCPDSTFLNKLCIEIDLRDMRGKTLFSIHTASVRKIPSTSVCGQVLCLTSKAKSYLHVSSLLASAKKHRRMSKAKQKLLELSKMRAAHVSNKSDKSRWNSIVAQFVLVAATARGTALDLLEM